LFLLEPKSNLRQMKNLITTLTLITLTACSGGATHTSGAYTPPVDCEKLKSYCHVQIPIYGRKINECKQTKISPELAQIDVNNFAAFCPL
jgi:hypothetical protein